MRFASDSPRQSRFATVLLAAAGLIGCIATSSTASAAAAAVEYYHAGMAHYFVTASPAEIAALDGGSVAGWQRTREWFAIPPAGTPGATNVCRFWSGQRYAPKSSHFYTPYAAECANLLDRRHWLYEGDAFALTLARDDGGCPNATVPLYRLYNNGLSGAPNHRYTTSPALRADMLAQGWIAEGVGVGVIGCVPAPTQASVTIVAAGDIGQCFDRPAAESGAAKTVALVDAGDSLLLTLGDHAYDLGSPQEYANCFAPTWGKVKDRIRPTPGNHDYYTAGAQGYFDFFGVQAGPERRGYYSFDYGGWHFISLNSLIDVSEGSEQHRWLLADLAASREALCTVAYWHYPAFNSGGVYGSITAMQPFFAALHAAGVELVLSGHEHIYERFAPQAADGTLDPLRGVRQFVVGTGGHARNPLGPPLGNSEFRSNEHWGVLRLALREGGYDWQFVPVGGGAPLDTGSGTCHR